MYDANRVVTMISLAQTHARGSFASRDCLLTPVLESTIFKNESLKLDTVSMLKDYRAYHPNKLSLCLAIYDDNSMENVTYFVGINTHYIMTDRSLESYIRQMMCQIYDENAVRALSQKAYEFAATMAILNELGVSVYNQVDPHETIIIALASLYTYKTGLFIGYKRQNGKIGIVPQSVTDFSSLL